MRKDLLETYNAVLSAGTTQGAAVRLGVSQSAVSRRLAQLEDWLGLSLFRREKSRLIPTADSAVLQSQITGLLENSRRLAAQAEALRQGNAATTTLRVAFPGSLSLTVVPRIIARFLASHDRVRIEVLAGPYDTIERMLLDDRAEVGFIRMPVGRPGLTTTPVIRTRTVCVMPRDHPLAAKSTISVKDLRNVPLILLGRMRAPRREIDELFWRFGIDPQVRVEAHSVSSACGLSAGGLGLSLVNELMAADYAHMPIAIRPLAEPIPHFFAFATPGRAEVSAAAESFIETAIAELGTL
jgi:DNA-binding transcriptional LysR family regulator